VKSPDRKHRPRVSKRCASRIPSAARPCSAGSRYYTTLAAALATCEALDSLDEVEVNRLQDLHQELS
jgi:hypothetical protein